MHITVCVEVLGMLKENLGKDAGKQAKVEKGITKFCKNKKLNSKQKKMVRGLADKIHKFPIS